MKTLFCICIVAFFGSVILSFILSNHDFSISIWAKLSLCFSITEFIISKYEKIKLSFFIPFTAGDNVVALLVIGVLLTFTLFTKGIMSFIIRF